MIKNHPRTIITHSSEETRELGEKIGISLTAGTVIALTGDLGSGKTRFVQGLARGLEVPAEYCVTSPTYTLVHEYPGRHPLFHIDLYRIEDAVDFEDMGLYDILAGDGVVAVEWAERLDKAFLSQYLSIHIETRTDDSRKISICEI